MTATVATAIVVTVTRLMTRVTLRNLAQVSETDIWLTVRGGEGVTVTRLMTRVTLRNLAQVSETDI